MNSGSESHGQYAERSFVREAERRDWQVQPANRQENIIQHIDYFITKQSTTYSVDVKAMKAVQRSAALQDEWHVVEFIAVTYPSSAIAFYKPPFDPINPDFSRGSGRAGWIYGDAELIAFELKNEWLFAQRRTLLDVCATKVDFIGVAPSAKEARYVVYSRPERGDLITYIHHTDIRDIAYGRWRKQ